MRNTADAEDAAQECYLRALRHFDSYRGPAMKPWLLTILRNVCNAEFARRGKQETLAECPAGRSRHRSRRRSGRSRKLLRKQPCCSNTMTTRSGIWSTHCPAQFREVIVLREINDLSYQEIAQVAGVPVGTVMSRLARARSMLRSAWNVAEGATP